jgi:hypothetical protein
MTTFFFPDWSDLGSTSSKQRDIWEHEHALREDYSRYFTGDIFNETVPLEAGSDEDAPLLYPVGINLVKMLCTAQADSLFGEWEEDIIRFRSRQDEDETIAGNSAVKLMSTILQNSKAQISFWEAGLEREAYGGTVFKVGWNMNKPWPHIEWSRINASGFLPVWHPDDPDVLLEAWIVSKITREQAKQLYGIQVEAEHAIRVEYWNRKRYDFWVDGRKIGANSGVNPYKLVPFVYIPRMRTNSWYGDAITPDIMPAQDELNMRVADLGEAINYNAHPIRYGTNLPRGFNADNYPLGPRAMWDLGRVIGQSDGPKVGLLEPKNPIPERALDYVNFIYDWSRTSAFAPPIAFGEDDGGGQRSGRTLEIRMWPLLRATRRSRGYMAGGIQRMMTITAKILSIKKLKERPVSSHAIERLADGTVVPDFWPIMPKDEAAIVDKIVKLMELPVPGISLETATKMLGLGPAEVTRIQAMLEDKLFGKYFKKEGEKETPSEKDPQKVKEQTE